MKTNTKQIIALGLFFASYNFSFSQGLKVDNETGLLTLSEVIQFPEKPESFLFSKASEWAKTNSANFNRKNGEKLDVLVDKKNTEVVDFAYKNDNPLKIESKEDGKLMIVVSAKYNGTSIGSIRTLYSTCDLKILVKDGKLKFETSNFSYNHINNATGKPAQISGFKDEGPCASKGTFENLSNCKIASKAYNKMIEWYEEDINKIKDSLIKYINSSKNEKDF